MPDDELKTLSPHRLLLGTFGVYVALVLPIHIYLCESLTPDGVSYRDLAHKVASGDWRGLVNSYWAPMLPALLAMSQRLEASFGAGSVAVSQVAMGAVSLAYFCSVWRLIGRLWGDGGWTSGRFLTRREVGVGCFVGAAALAAQLLLVGPQVLTPDTLAGVFCVLATGDLVRATGVEKSKPAAWLAGLWLGCGYLAKYPLFVFGLWLVVLLLGRKPRVALRVGGGFALVALPWAAMLSLKYGRMTFGDAGWLNLAWFTGQAPIFVGYGLGEDWTWAVNGTYAPWLDPAAFHEGLRVELPWSRMWRNVVWHLSWWWRSSVFLGVLSLVLFLWWKRRPTLDWRFWWPAGALASYLPVTLMTRYAAVWVFLLCALWGVRALSAKAQIRVALLLLALACWPLRKLPEERAAGERARGQALAHLSFAGADVHVEGDGFAASLVLHRVGARIASQSSTIKGPWQILDSSGSVLWVIPWRATFLKPGTQWPSGPIAAKRQRN